MRRRKKNKTKQTNKQTKKKQRTETKTITNRPIKAQVFNPTVFTSLLCGH